MKELIIKRLKELEELEESVNLFYFLKDYIENIINYMIEANRFCFLAHIIDYEEYIFGYNLILKFMTKYELERR